MVLLASKFYLSRKAVDLFSSEKPSRNLNINDIVFYITGRVRLLFPVTFLIKLFHLKLEIHRGLIKM